MFSFLCVFFRKKIKKVLSETRSFFLCGVYREEKKKAGRKTIKDSISNHAFPRPHCVFEAFLGHFSHCAKEEKITKSPQLQCLQNC